MSTRSVQQVAQHIAFGDPDFLNGPTHALRIVRRCAPNTREPVYSALTGENMPKPAG